MVAVLSSKAISVGQETELDSGSGGSPPSNLKGYVQLVFVKLPGELNVLLDRTTVNAWSLLENLTPYIVTKGTNYVDPRCTMPGWSYRVTLVRESGSEWSILELGKIFMEGNIHGNIKECKGQAKNVVSCMREFLDTAQGEIGRDVAVFGKRSASSRRIGRRTPNMFSANS